MLALSGLREGFARGLVPLHNPPLFGRKPSSVKSRVSITYKLIQNKGLQVPYFDHLQKTGGRGSYRLVHAAHHPAELRPHAPVRPSQKRTSPLPAVSANLCVLSASALDFVFVRSSLSANGCLLSPLFPLHTRSCPVSLLVPLHTQKQGDTPPQKCRRAACLARRRADIFDFSPYIRTFSPRGCSCTAGSSPEERALSQIHFAKRLEIGTCAPRAIRLAQLNDRFWTNEADT
jgi:hypothetical protein